MNKTHTQKTVKPWQSLSKKIQIRGETFHIFNTIRRNVSSSQFDLTGQSQANSQHARGCVDINKQTAELWVKTEG